MAINGQACRLTPRTVDIVEQLPLPKNPFCSGNRTNVTKVTFFTFVFHIRIKVRESGFRKMDPLMKL